MILSQYYPQGVTNDKDKLWGGEQAIDLFLAVYVLFNVNRAHWSQLQAAASVLDT